MHSSDTIIDALGGTKEVAAALSLSLSTVSSWRGRGRGRGRIPHTRWAPLVRIAADRGCSEITLQALADLAAREPAGASA